MLPITSGNRLVLMYTLIYTEKTNQNQLRAPFLIYPAKEKPAYLCLMLHMYITYLILLHACISISYVRSFLCCLSSISYLMRICFIFMDALWCFVMLCDACDVYLWYLYLMLICIVVGSNSSSGFSVEIEDYLLGLCGVPSELSRFSVNSVTMQNFEWPQRCSLFVSNLFGSFRLLNLKNNNLRKRYDSIKYDVKKLEEVVYDITVANMKKQ